MVVQMTTINNSFTLCSPGSGTCSNMVASIAQPSMGTQTWIWHDLLCQNRAAFGLKGLMALGKFAAAISTAAFAVFAADSVFFNVYMRVGRADANFAVFGAPCISPWGYLRVAVPVKYSTNLVYFQLWICSEEYCVGRTLFNGLCLQSFTVDFQTLVQLLISAIPGLSVHLSASLTCHNGNSREVPITFLLWVVP